MEKEKAKKLCANCGTELVGKFCHNCGEKKVSRKDFAASNFIQEVFEKFTHFDSKFLRSFWLLVSRPGFLTVEYWRGRRKPYLKPLSLFFIINLLYFLSIGVNHTRTYETPLRIQLLNLYSPVVQKMLDERFAAATEEERKDFETRFDRQNHTLAKSMLVLMVPVFAAVLWLLYWRQGFYFGEHLVTALHFQALLLVQNMVVGIFLKSGLFHILFGYFAHSDVVQEVVEPLLWVWALAFFTQKTVYRESRLRTALKAAVFALSWMPILILYRFMVFMATFYGVG
jgi:hypothetical protein